MSKTVKFALFGVAGLVLAALFVPGFSQLFSGLLRDSETIIVPAPGAPPGGNESVQVQEFKLVTLLGFDAIPAILDPVFVSMPDAQGWMEPDEQVLGLSINGDHRAYSVRMLSRHEIVNDVVGGMPVAVTW